MYEATEKQREYLKNQFQYDDKNIEVMEKTSDEVRRGIPISPGEAMAVLQFQEHLSIARRKTKSWWKFWK